MDAHCEVTITWGSSQDVELEGSVCNIMVTFDGGSRKVRGHDVAAGAAVFWTRTGTSAPWARRLTTTRAVPSGADART
eukprot:1441519-Lingulodinium_polyedra.AAC.1